MIRQIFIYLIISSFILSCNSQNSNDMEFKLPEIGMDISDFAKDFPEVVNGDVNGNKQYGYDIQIKGLDGGWAYTFEDNKLKWFLYDSYENELTQENFDKYLQATQVVIDDFKQKYGEPVEFIFENKTFKDPYVEHHWGYDVISAVWKTDKMDFKVEFTFMGGKGEYHFIFKMEFQPSGYEYF